MNTTYKRGRKRRPRGIDCEITRWRTACGCYAVERVHSLLTWTDQAGRTTRLPDRYLAIALDNPPALISRHWTRRAAQRAIEKARRSANRNEKAGPKV